MAASSTHLVIIFTYLQVNTIFNAYGLTLPLQTVTTKCESIINRPKIPNQECVVNDKLACDSLPPDLSYRPLLPLEPCARSSILSPVGNCPFVNYQEGLFTASVIPKEAPLTSIVCPDTLINVTNSMSLGDPTIKSCIGDSKPCGLRLPIAVSSTVNSLPSPKLKSPECINSCNKVPVSITNVIIEDFVPVSTVISQEAMPNQILASNTCSTACTSCPTGFKSSFTVSSSSNCGSHNINVIPSNSKASVIFDAVSQPINPKNLLSQPEKSFPVSPPNNSPLEQTCKKFVNLNNKGSIMSDILTSGIPSCNLATNAPVGSNNMDQIGNVLPNTLPNTCNFTQLTPGATCPNQSLLSTPASSADIHANKLDAAFNNPPISTTFTPPSMFDISNIINKTQGCPIPVSEPSLPESDIMFSPLSISSQVNHIPTSVPFNANSFVNPFSNYHTQLPLSPDLPLTHPVQGYNICPNIESYPQKGCAILPQLNSLPYPNLMVSNENSELRNDSPFSVNQISPLNKYFKDARAATAKLNDFIESFTSKLSSKNIPQLQSLVDPSQRPSLQSYINMSLEKKCESAPLASSARSVSQPNPSLQQNIIPREFPDSSMNPSIASTQICVDKTATLAPSVVPVTFKAPIVPKTIISAFNFPICSAPVQFNNFHNNLALLSASNCSPYPFTDFLTTIPSNQFVNFGSCSNKPDGSLIPTGLPKIPSFMPQALPSVLKRPTLGTTLPNPTINTYEDVTSLLMPDLRSLVFPKSSYPCDLPCKKPFPCISSISINTSPECEQVADSCVASSGLSKCTLDALSSILSSPIGSFSSSDSSIDISQLGLCCENLENVINLLESSMDQSTM